MTKVNVTALQTVSHGNLDMKQGKVYTMSKGEAQELAKAGFVSLESTGESEGTLGEHVAQKKQPGDTTVEDDADAKMEGTPKNKMADAPVNKSSKKAD